MESVKERYHKGKHYAISTEVLTQRRGCRRSLQFQILPHGCVPSNDWLLATSRRRISAVKLSIEFVYQHIDGCCCCTLHAAQPHCLLKAPLQFIGKSSKQQNLSCPKLERRGSRQYAIAWAAEQSQAVRLRLGEMCEEEKEQFSAHTQHKQVSTSHGNVPQGEKVIA
jgi:hypothetical protein